MVIQPAGVAVTEKERCVLTPFVGVPSSLTGPVNDKRQTSKAARPRPIKSRAKNEVLRSLRMGGGKGNLSLAPAKSAAVPQNRHIEAVRVEGAGEEGGA